MEPSGETDRIGTPFFELRPGLLGHVLGILERAVQSMVLATPGVARMKEVPINARLRPYLVDEASHSIPSVYVIPEGSVYSDGVGGQYSSAKTGEPDFLAIFTCSFQHPQRYLGIECKKVSGLRAGNYTSYYINAGVQRFVDCSYSRGHPCAVMAGYVFEGDPASAAAFICRALAKKATLLGVQDGLSRAHDFPDHQHLYCSTHSQRETCVPIRLMHLFISLN